MNTTKKKMTCMASVWLACAAGCANGSASDGSASEGGSGDGPGGTRGSTASDGADETASGGDSGAGDGPHQIGQWRECIIGDDGAIDLTLYESVAQTYHTADVVDCRLGPKYTDFHDTPRQANTVYQPDPEGLWRGGLDPALAEAFCVTSDELPTNEAEEAMLYDSGGAWIMSGQLLFSPNPDAPTELAAGCANARNFDGAMARLYDEAGELQTRALCMRARAEWYPDWWNRNGISVPTSTVIDKLVEAYPGLPLPPVATARGETQASVTGFLAFQNGLIAAAGTGNDSYTFGVGDVEPALQLPPGKVPTAIAVTPTNEFVLVTVWDVNEHKGQLGVIAVGTDDPAVISLEGHGRHGWGVFNWPGIHALKLLGFVDLPMMAPTSLSVTNSSAPKSLRGHDEWLSQDLSQQAVRDEWYERPWYEMSDQTKFLMLAHTGYAVVASRAEDKVAFVDLEPLFQYYRTMYLTTEERWDQTADDNQGPGPDQWPYTFEHAPEQLPVVLSPVLDVPQPTAVLARKRENSTNSRAYFDDPNSPRAMYETAVVASMDGTVRIYDTKSLGDPTLPTTVSPTPKATMMVGPNPTQVTAPISGDIRMDDIFVVSRGGSTISVFRYDGELIGVLDDARLQDPVFVSVGGDNAGYGGSGPGLAVYARILTVLDHDGQQVVDYGMDDLVNNNGEQWPYVDDQGQPTLFLHGYSNPLPGSPFMMSFDEVI